MSFQNRIRSLENQHRECVARLEHLNRDPAINHRFILESTVKKSQIESELRELRRREYDERDRVDLSDDR